MPEEIIRRRYYAGLRNLVNYYLPLVDIALILDNSSGTSNNIIAKKDKLNDLQIKDKKIWKMIQRLANEKIEQN